MSRGWHDRGYLPHCDREGLSQHVVFHLADALAVRLTPRHCTLASAEEELDKGMGASLLADTQAGAVVATALRHFDGERYRLHAWCVMPNHVHALLNIVASHELGALVRS